MNLGLYLASLTILVILLIGLLMVSVFHKHWSINFSIFFLAFAVTYVYYVCDCPGSGYVTFACSGIMIYELFVFGRGNKK